MTGLSTDGYGQPRRSLLRLDVSACRPRSHQVDHQPPGHLTEEEKTRLSQVKVRSTQLSAVAGHVTAFAEVMTGRHGGRLPGWITAVDLDDLAHLHSLTSGIRRDQAAVPHGLTSSTAAAQSKAMSAA